MLAMAVVLAAVFLAAEKIKGISMEAKHIRRSCASRMSRSVATKCKSVFRQWVGQSIIITTAMTASMTAGVAGQQS
jgi:hypothetical protein